MQTWDSDMSADVRLTQVDSPTWPAFPKRPQSSRLAVSGRSALGSMTTGFLPEDGHIPDLYWPTAVIEDLKLDGQVYEIEIV